jgi:GT2 family glycosyltransferase
VEGVEILQQDPQVVGVNTNMIMPWVMSLEQFRKTTSQNDFPAYEYQLTPYGFVRYVEVAQAPHVTNFMTGGGFFVRRSIVQEGGYLFDPVLDMYCEDTELSLRVQRCGGSIAYCPQAIIYHNQASRKASTFHELIKLVRITRNRFSLFARINSPLTFTLKYPMYLIGIIKKMSYLGLSLRKRMVAYIMGIGIAFLFFCLFPYWLIYSLKYNCSGEVIRNYG